MALIKCKECGAEISDKAGECIHCGAEIILEDKTTNKENEIELDNKEIVKVEKLRKELEKEKLINEAKRLEKEIEKEKKNSKEKKNIFKTIINILRYAIVGFCTLGVIVNLVNFNIMSLFFFLVMGVLFCPDVYEYLFKKVDLPTRFQIIIQIFLPIIMMVLLGMLL